MQSLMGHRNIRVRLHLGFKAQLLANQKMLIGFKIARRVLEFPIKNTLNNTHKIRF